MSELRLASFSTTHFVVAVSIALTSLLKAAKSAATRLTRARTERIGIVKCIASSNENEVLAEEKIVRGEESQFSREEIPTF